MANDPSIIPTVIRGSLIVPPKGSSTGGSGGFVITMNYGGGDGSDALDKTWGEILTAYNDGQTLILKVNMGDTGYGYLNLAIASVDEASTTTKTFTFMNQYSTDDLGHYMLELIAEISSSDNVNYTSTFKMIPSTSINDINGDQSELKIYPEDIPAASASTIGGVKLSDATDSDLNAATGGTAATPYAVKQLATLVGEKTSFREVTQAEYDALVAANTDDPEVIYVITDSDDSKITGLIYETIHQNQSTWYGTSSTVANSAGKTVTTTGGDFVLKAGKKVTVKFENGNTASDITLNVDGMGIKRVTRYGTVTSGIYPWSAGAVIDFIYDGESFIALNATPTIHIGTKTPSASDGIDGDIFLVYDAQS